MSENEVTAKQAAWSAVINYAFNGGYDDLAGDLGEDYPADGIYDEESYDRYYDPLEDVRSEMCRIAEFLRAVEGEPLWHRDLWMHRRLTEGEAKAVRALKGLADVSDIASGFGISQAMVFSIWERVSFPDL
ncbi:hypothetical protein MINTMi198_17640 [Mycobacterium intracellulare M.i.198]|uniref:hypothetical protein n=1 Tax=Mycobacterium intracellulare TaxID=1767 RepID=UPI0003665C72|nr:hypothetical protein [Mycobacterium intracellulare]BCP36394.1 hypothetical protein MINTMi198_17640 [Mycobacterium intracellulare M.i.198]